VEEALQVAVSAFGRRAPSSGLSIPARPPWLVVVRGGGGGGGGDGGGGGRARRGFPPLLARKH